MEQGGDTVRLPAGGAFLLALLLATPLAAQQAEPEVSGDGRVVTIDGERLAVTAFGAGDDALWRPGLTAAVKRRGGPAPGECGAAIMIPQGSAADASRSFGAYCARMGDEKRPVKLCWDETAEHGAGEHYAVSTLVDRPGTPRARRDLAGFILGNCWGV